jgi:NADPH2:quinone reductase
VGVFWGAFAAREPEVNAANFRALFDWYTQGKLEPHISHRFALEDAKDALAAIAERRVLGKAVLTTGRS